MDMSQSSKPDRPMSATAAKAGGNKSKTPSLETTASHVPMRGESVTATHGKHVDGLAKYANMSMSSFKEGSTKEEFSKRTFKNAGSYVNKSA